MPAPLPLLVRLLPGVAFALFGVGLLVSLSDGGFLRNGDGWEYYATLEALARHATPDIREDDFATTLGRVNAPPGDVGGYNFQMRLPHCYRTASDGKQYALHFWAYPLAAVPAKFGLRAFGGNELNALRVANGYFFLLGLGAAVFFARGPWWRRGMFALLVCVNPVVWYLSFTGAEVFSWSLAVVAVVGLDRERYGLAALAAGLAATQNPPLVLLAGVAVLVAFRRKRWKQSAFAAAGAATAFLPAAFYLIHFGTPSLIGEGYVNPKLVGVDRTLSLLFDLNIGLLPYVPGLVLALPFTVARLALRREVRGVLVAVAVAAMMLGVQVQINWNSDCRGMMRYLVWMLPPLAWLAVEGLPPRWLAGVVAVGSLAAGAMLVYDPPSVENYVEERAVARWVLREAPYLYNPLPEIFYERQLHWEDDLAFEVTDDLGPHRRVALPLAFGKTNGEVTKLLVHRESAPRLVQRFVIDPEYLPMLLAEAEASEKMVYVHPPKGAVKARPWTVHGAYPKAGDPWPFTGRGEDPWVREQGEK